MPRSRRTRRLAAIALALALAAGAVTVSPRDASASPDGWRCPPCGCSEDGRTFTEPGTCPACGMALVRADSFRRVGVLVYEGVELLDFAGPAEVFVASHVFEVVTVGETKAPVRSLGVVSVTPDVSIDECPELDLLLVPGGSIGAVLESERLMSWLRARSNTTDHMLSVCNGAFVLGELGLLDGRSATTHHGHLSSLREEYPKATVVENVRYVDEEKVVTSAGVAAGIDMSLHVVAKIAGADTARRTARYMQYAWEPGGEAAAP